MPTKSEKNNWTTIRVACVGVTPLLQNDFGANSNAPISGDETLEEEICRKAYKLDGKFGFPREILYACLRDAGTMSSVTFEGKKKKITMSNKKTLIYGLLRIMDGFIFFENKAKPVPDMRHTVNPNTGGRNLTKRPRFDTWSFKVSIEFDSGIIPERVLRELFDNGGRWFGLGDFRPSRGGPFGQFKIVSWEVV